MLLRIALRIYSGDDSLHDAGRDVYVTPTPNPEPTPIPSPGREPDNSEPAPSPSTPPSLRYEGDSDDEGSQPTRRKKAE